MPPSPFETEIGYHVWDAKYRRRENGQPVEPDIEATRARIATALAAAETGERDRWKARFAEALADFRYLPAGRIQAGAGTGHKVTLFNCFVMGRIADDMESIFSNLYEGAITMQQGGGIGVDFTTLRPRGTAARGVGAIASGPVSFMDVWDAMCGTILSTGARRGAMMATLRCDHPDIEEFVAAKAESGRLTNFNVSVQVTDAFMAAVRKDEDWPLVFPEDSVGSGGERVMRDWPGYEGAVACRTLRSLPARTLWDAIMHHTYAHAEPGVLFVDTVNRTNNLAYCERITATNPCGEIPLPPYGACDLGSLNLTKFVRDPFTRDARLDLEALEAIVPTAVRMLDNVIDVSRYPLAAQAEKARSTRRTGLGMTGLADALIMLGLHYDSDAARSTAGEAMRRICHAAYRASIELAKEKGAFPAFERDAYLASPFVSSLPADIRDGIAGHGIRNSHLLSIAPAGSISLLADNVSSGLEPVYAFEQTRALLDARGERQSFSIEDYAWRHWQAQAKPGDRVAPAFVTVADLPARAHLDMQAALQPHVDNAVSKTVNVPEEYPFEAFKDLYMEAYDLGLKGCTTFRPNPVTGSILTAAGANGEETAHCCTVEREGD